ncbi:MAG: hypothetical protein J5I93_25680 [Pirellulaceae bacterium]|nr:hypothetical protein [Pirellulaceae bacterium]
MNACPDRRRVHAWLDSPSRKTTPRVSARARMETARLLAGLVLLAGLCLAVATPAAAQQAAQPRVPAADFPRLDAVWPAACRDFDARRAQQLAGLAEQLEVWCAERVWDRQRPDEERILAVVGQLIAAHQHVDRLLDEALGLRGGFVELPDEERREALRRYLEFTSRVIDLSGRLRYLMRDAIDTAAFDLDGSPRGLSRLLDLLSEQRVSIGAAVMTYVLFDPPPGSGFQPYPREIKVKALQLIARTQQVDALPQLAEFVQQPETPTDLAIAAAEVIRRVGLPQEPIPGQDPTLPEPAITARQLKQVLDQRDPAGLSAELRRYHQELLVWLGGRIRRGVTEDELRIGKFRVRAGDWLLMRNPSPYNLFTDLSPGLFTHVGVVAVRTHADGIRRFVIVDLPERGDHIPETNVDLYLLRTLHYFFLRHEDPEVCAALGTAADKLAGNESVFDLTFRTDRVTAVRDRPLDDMRVHTYCAGFLLLCAQQTQAPREQFFPIEEFPAGERCAENLRKLGLSLGENFVSPTGALFSPHLQLVGRREPMYSPDREIKEAIYDYFAQSMIEKQVAPSPDAAQALRQKVAELSRLSSWLAKALARLHNVSEHMDLASAAKAAAAVETLDEIADDAARQFLEAREALLAGPLDQLPPEENTAELRERIGKYRQLHAELYRRLLNPGLSPRQLRLALVEHYSDWGRRRIDNRFFPATAP